jgi:hypothetical protein
MWINLDLDVSILETIEKKIGKLLTPNLVESSLSEKLGRKKLDSMTLIAWKKKLAIDNSAYHEFIQEFSEDWGASLAEIDTDTEFLLPIAKKLCEGISKVDVSLLANARWIRSRSEYEPLILSDDSDLLASTHALSSFFGISLGCLSAFEMLRLIKEEEPITKCCNYFDINEGFAGLDQVWSQSALEKSIGKFLKKGKIGCHVNKRIMQLIKNAR